MGDESEFWLVSDETASGFALINPPCRLRLPPGAADAEETAPFSGNQKASESQKIKNSHYPDLWEPQRGAPGCVTWPLIPDPSPLRKNRGSRGLSKISTVTSFRDSMCNILLYTRTTHIPPQFYLS